MSDKGHSVTIDSITCKSTTESGNDEVFIVYQVDAGVPVRHPVSGYQRMATKANASDDVVSTWLPTLTVDFDHEVLVTLWDQDARTGWNKADFLINASYRSDYFASSTDMQNNNGAHYVIAATKVS